MQVIAFYISNHGFGHVARNIPIIKELLIQNKELKIIVKTSEKQLQFMKQSLEKFSTEIDYYESNNDIGLILKKGSIEVDKAELENNLYEFINEWDIKIQEEKQFLINKEVNLVISDITPWIFKSCKLANIKSIFISNFTWVEIYRELFNSDIYLEYLKCYELADFALIYPISGDIEKYFKKYKKVGLCCREFNEDEVSKIKRRYNKPIVFSSVGKSVNLDKHLNVENLPYDFIYTDGIHLIGKNTTYLPIETDNTNDYIKASDYVITKAGWSTAAEAICARKPMLVIDRDEVVEDRITINELKKLGIAVSINSEELYNLNVLKNLLCKLDNKDKNYAYLDNTYNNCSKEISKEILSYIREVQHGKAK